MKIIMNLNQVCLEIFDSSHRSVFTWKNRPADCALSLIHRCSSLGCILTLSV